VDHRTWRAFVAMAGELVDTGTICRRVWPRKSKFHPEDYRRVREAAAGFADPVARGPGRGRPWLWRLKSDSL
jgi:hypothetical protein